MFDQPFKSSSVSMHASPDRLLSVWLDSPGRSVNIFDSDMLLGLETVVAQLRLYPQRYRGILFRSRKTNNFFAGADVHAIAALHDPDVVEQVLVRGQALMRQISMLPVPTIAIIDGACMGGGLEFALACKYRIARRQPGTLLALPEIKLGLIPGWGGTQRLPRLIGASAALEMILKGSPTNVSKALRSGLIDAAIDAEHWDEQLPGVVEEVLQGRAKSHRVSHWQQWLFDSTWPGQRLLYQLTRKSLLSKIKSYPAIDKAIAAVAKSTTLGDDGFSYERSAFTELLFGQTAKNLIGLFLQRENAKRPSSWIETESHYEPFADVAVIGAGAMGAGIAALVASKGLGVVLKDINDDLLAAGRGRIESQFANLVDRGRLLSNNRDDILQHIQYTTSWNDTADCDLAIEAVVEIDEVKQQVFQTLDQLLGRDAVLTSNTSSLNVTRMATCTNRRSQVAGLHFFNPVEQMDLVEVVRTETTDEQTIRRLLEFVRALGKVPVITSDKPGFLVNRVLFPYLGEAVRLVSEGVQPQQIDQEMRAFGMPMGPLELLDQVGLDIAAHVAKSLAAIQDDTHEPAVWLSEMTERGWLGKKSKRGFYVYGQRRRVKLNTELGEIFRDSKSSGRHAGTALTVNLFVPDGLSDIQRRLVYSMLNEAVHCLDEQVVAEAWMVDLGMVLGTGFAPHHGGPLRLIDTLGCTNVHQNLLILAEQHGQRYQPAHGIVRVSRAQGRFHQHHPAEPKVREVTTHV